MDITGIFYCYFSKKVKMWWNLIQIVRIRILIRIKMWRNLITTVKRIQTGWNRVQKVKMWWNLIQIVRIRRMEKCNVIQIARNMEDEVMHSKANIEGNASLHEEVTTEVIAHSLSVIEEVSRTLLRINNGDHAIEEEQGGKKETKNNSGNNNNNNNFPTEKNGDKPKSIPSDVRTEPDIYLKFSNLNFHKE